jgi:uncharacterized protein (DUF2062 family)
MGLRRVLIYHSHRLHRIPASPSNIAAGFAIGLGVAVSPVVGSHMILASIISWIFDVSIFAAVIGTLTINPWTAPPVWFATYYVGRFIEREPVHGAPPFIEMFKGLTESALRLDWPLFMRDVWPIFKPMVVGAVPLGLLAGVCAYVVVLPIIGTLQGRRALRISKAVPKRDAAGGSEQAHVHTDDKPARQLGKGH